MLRALRALPRLASLHLPRCRKLGRGLPAALTAALAAPEEAGAAAAQQPPPPTLRTLMLQRCFQLDSEALTQLLGASAARGSRLRCLALSHLGLGAWPLPRFAAALGGVVEAPAPVELPAVAAEEEGGEANHAQQPAPSREVPAAPPLLKAAEEEAEAPAPIAGGSLRLLALHNCGKATAAGLQALARACPSLEALFLGGCSFAIGVLAPSAGDGAPPPRFPRAFAPAGGGAWLDVPALRGQLTAAVAKYAARGALPGGVMGAWVGDVAVELALVAAMLPALRVLELTFAPPGLVPLLQHLSGTPVSQVFCQR